MKEKRTFLEWVQVHKKELIITGVSITVVVGIVGIRKRESLMELWKTLQNAIKYHSRGMAVPHPTASAISSVTEDVIKPVIPGGFLDNLTGNKLTATGLGDKVWFSAQAINKRLVSSGLAEKLPCGEYSITEAGKFLGEHTLKTTRAGYTFSNIEWEEKVLELIFSPKELREIAEKQLRAREILNGFAA